MAATSSFINTVKDATIRIQNSDATNLVTVLLGASSGQRIKSLMITSDDTSSRTLQFTKSIGGVDYILGEIPVAAGAGTDGATVAVNGLDAAKMPGLQSDGINRFMDLASGVSLKAKTKTTLTAAKIIYITAEYGDF